MEQTAVSDRLGNEAIVPLLFRLSIPSIIAMAVQALYNIVDSIYVGRISKQALSALSLAFPVQLIVIGTAVGTGVGVSSLISRLLGKGDKKRATNAAEHVMLIAVIYGIVVAFVGVFFSHEIIAAFTEDKELIQMGSEYISIILMGSFALFFPMLADNILRGQGNTFIPMITMLIGSILNVILDPLFIFGLWGFPRWGIKGAAFATVLSRIISGSFMMFILFSEKNDLDINIKNFKFDFSIIKSIYQVGFPAMVMQFLASFMVAGMNKILVSYSTTAIAAAGIYFKLQSFVFMPVFGLNHGFMPILGYNYGHRNPDRMKKAIKAAFVIGFAFTFAGFIVFQVFAEQLVRMFNDDAELIKIGVKALKTISLAFPIIGPAIVAGTTFQALGRGLPSLLLSFLRQIIVLLPAMYVLGIYFGLDGVWYAFPLSEIVNAVIGGIWLVVVLKQTFDDMRM
ncbi:MAG: MATE family efflux transporter [Clostridia bacterium]|nr:MATE family efflux transporter [Clostridia bacterium]